MAEGKVTGVFVRQRRNDCFREISSRRLVRKSPPIVAAIPSGSVAQLGIGIQSHALAGLHSSPDERRIIHAVLCCQPKFTPGGKWRKLGVGAHGRKIWNNPEHAFGLLAFGIIFLLLDWGCDKRLSRRRRLGLRLGSAVRLHCRSSAVFGLLILLLGHGVALLVRNSRLGPKKCRRQKKR